MFPSFPSFVLTVSYNLARLHKARDGITGGFRKRKNERPHPSTLSDHDQTLATTIFQYNKGLG